VGPLQGGAGSLQAGGRGQGARAPLGQPRLRHRRDAAAGGHRRSRLQAHTGAGGGDQGDAGPRGEGPGGAALQAAAARDHGCDPPQLQRRRRGREAGDLRPRRARDPRAVRRPGRQDVGRGQHDLRGQRAAAREHPGHEPGRVRDGRRKGPWASDDGRGRPSDRGPGFRRGLSRRGPERADEQARGGGGRRRRQVLVGRAADAARPGARGAAVRRTRSRPEPRIIWSARRRARRRRRTPH
jgi:hypothetical protein